MTDVEVSRLSTVDDPEVDGLLDECPTSFAQQTTSWRDVITATDRDEPVFLGCRQGGRLVGLLPGYRFEGPLGAILTSVPLPGPLGGVLCHPTADADRVTAALIDAYVEHAVALGCDLATLITNPFWPDRRRVAQHLKPDYVLENSLLALDLERDCDPDGGPSRATSALRRNLRKARSGALFVDEEQSEPSVAEWYKLHQERHGEIGAPPLPRALVFGTLRHMVPRDRARFFFVRTADTEEMVAGGLYLTHGLVIDAFMPAMRSASASLRPNHLLAAHTIQWARERGLRFYNWQGSPPGGGVHRFKAQWGSRELSYAFLTRVTGNATRFIEAEVADLQQHYAWHYVLPFDRVGAGASREPGPSTRRDVWNARQTASAAEREESGS